MTKDELLLAHEGVMQEACNQCRYPLECEDEETMYAEQCDHCQIDAQLTAALEAAAKPRTNADRLRTMTDEELAKWFNRHFTCPPTYSCPKDEASCEKCFLYWLREEATE